MMQNLSDQARVWLFGADRPFTSGEVEQLRSAMSEFVSNWSAHRVPLAASVEVMHERFLVVGLDESSSASGCSIDSLFHRVGELERQFGVRLLDSSLLFFSDEKGEVQSTDRSGFRKLAAEGSVTASTSVYDPTLGTLGDLRRSFPLEAAESWHRQLLD